MRMENVAPLSPPCPTCPPVYGGEKRFDIEGPLPLCFHDTASHPWADYRLIFSLMISMPTRTAEQDHVRPVGPIR